MNSEKEGERITKPAEQSDDRAREICRRGLAVTLAIALATIICGMIEPAFADEVPDPGLAISVSGTNVYLTVTNGVSFANYEIYRRPLLDEAYPWTLHLTGDQGQTNFTAAVGVEFTGFFKATAGLDWDNDGVENWWDGNPGATNVLGLSITIDSPANGATFD